MNRVAILLLFGIVTTNAALAITETDQELLDYGIVDEDFIYQDLEAAGSYFQGIADRQAVSLPQKTSSELEWISNSMTPYNATLTYKYNFEIDSESEKILKKAARDPAFVNDMCKTYYTDRFLKANNYQVLYVYVDASYRNIYNFKMSNSVCKKALGEVLAAGLFE